MTECVWGVGACSQVKYIRLHDGAPMLLLGRSGTGKTTCMVFRLWTEFFAYWSQANLASPQLPGGGEGVLTHMHQVCLPWRPLCGGSEGNCRVWRVRQPVVWDAH